jgi:hypothetical protein
MLKSKLYNYKFVANIHTIDVESKNPPKFYQGITKMPRASIADDKLHYFTQINPNSLFGGDIFAYSQYEEVMQEILRVIEIDDDWKYHRVDFKLDCYDDCFIDYFKLHHLLFYLFTTNDRVPEVRTFTQDSEITGIKVSRKHFEATYYDKEKERGYPFPIKARTELRAKNLNGKSPIEAVDYIFKRLDALPSLYENLQHKLNIKEYNSYRAYCERLQADTRKDMITDFVKENRDSFFHFNQLTEFCEICGSDSPTHRAKSIKQTAKLEFFRKSDISDYIANIKGAMSHFMSA